MAIFFYYDSGGMDGEGRRVREITRCLKLYFIAGEEFSLFRSDSECGPMMVG